MKNLLLLLFIAFFKTCVAQQVQLRPDFCNTNLTALGSNFYWTTNNSQQYRVKITNGGNTWIYDPGFTTTGSPKTFTNLIFAGVNPQYNTTYLVQVDYMISGAWQNNWGNSCSLTTPTFVPIQLETTYCGTSLPSLSSIFRAQTITGGTTWRFKITNTVDGSVKVVDKGSSFGSTTNRRTTSISELASLPGTGSLTPIGQAIYTVECAVSVQDGPFSVYGPICNVTITQSLNPTIVSSDCGIEHNYIFQDFIDVVPPTPSTGCTYQFRLIDQSNLTILESSVVTVPKIKIYDIPGFAYNKTYSASVRCIRQGIVGNYGTSCILYTENQPYTKIQDGQFSTLDNCDVDRTFTQRLYAFAIPGGSYEFEITNGLTTYLHRTNNIRSFRLSEVTGYVNVYNTQHHVKVRVSMDNYTTFGPWGESCWVRTPMAIIQNDPGFIENESQLLKLTIFPNPSENNFSLNFVDEDLFELVNIKLYDFEGRLIFEKSINDYEINGLSFGEGFKPGIYHLIIQYNDELERFKLLKSK